MDELERRLALLRAPKAATAASPPPPGPTEESIESRLSALDPPKESADGREELDVVVETKNVDDDEVAQFLSDAALSPPSSLPPLSSPTSRRLNSALSSYESTSSTFASPIEVAFFGSPSSQSRTMDEDDALIKRLQDELSVETKVQNRDEGKMSELERRLEGLKEFRLADGSGTRKKEEAGDGLGPPPSVGGLDGLEGLSKKAGRRKARTDEHSDIDEDDEDSEDSQESEASNDSAEDDSEEDR